MRRHQYSQPSSLRDSSTSLASLGSSSSNISSSNANSNSQSIGSGVKKFSHRVNKNNHRTAVALSSPVRKVGLSTKLRRAGSHSNNSNNTSSALSEGGSIRSTGTSKSVPVASPSGRRFGNSANNWKDTNNLQKSSSSSSSRPISGRRSPTSYLTEAKDKLRRSPSPPRNRFKSSPAQAQAQAQAHSKPQQGKQNTFIGSGIRTPTKTPSPRPSSSPVSATSLASSLTSASTSAANGTPKGKFKKSWANQSPTTPTGSAPSFKSTRTAPPALSNNRGGGSSLTTSSATPGSTLVNKNTYTQANQQKQEEKDKTADMTMQDSGDQSNVWVRHSLLVNVLNPRPSYGSSASVASMGMSSQSINQNIPTTPLRKTPSFLKNSYTPNGFTGVSGATTPSFHTKLKQSSDDASTSASTTSSSLSSNLTTPAKWGWVKAVLLNNGELDSSHNSSREQNNGGKSSGNADNEHPRTSPHKVPSWQKFQKGVPPTTPTKPTPEKNARLEAKIQAKSKVVLLKIIDLESEFHGQTVEVPMSMIPPSRDADGDTKMRNGNGGNATIFGNAIVMANAWSEFTAIPERKEKDAGSKAISTTPTKAKSKWSSYGKKSHSKHEEKKEDVESDNGKHAVPSDLTNLTHLHEPAVVYCLRSRYAMNEIYTSTGPILLALNPFKEVSGIYGDDLMRKYCDRGQGMLNGFMDKKKGGAEKNDSRSPLPPHVYAVADNAYRAMMRAIEDGSRSDGSSESDSMPDQSILVSGESGAGKTVTTKIIMKYLANLSKRSNGKKKVEKKSISSRWNGRPHNFSGPPQDAAGPLSPNSARGRNIEQQVLESNPILESFGNARTLRNDNSSRFGKFIEIKFSNTGRLMGASVDSYLLEKVRLVNHADGERNYHIFYELLTGASSSERKDLLLGRSGPHDFVMTSSPSETFKRRDGVRDDTTFAALRKAMVTMGFDPQDQREILRIVSSLLHLSNLTFAEDSSGCTLDSRNASLGLALQLLGVSGKALERALCCVNIEAGGERVVKKLFLDQSIKAKEALIKATYGALFTYLVQRINNCINGGEHTNAEETAPTLEPAAFIGVLDIFGFESFEKNSFEQLCINYCNESLQQQFNKFVFKLEQAEYESEGIQWNFIAFPDNQNVLDFIDKKRIGVLSILDEQSFLTQCTDQSFAQLVYQKHGGGSSKNNPFSASSRQMANGAFSINHYAGPVEYDSTGFLEKNKDELPKEIDELLHSSENMFLKHLATVMNGSLSSSDVSDAITTKSMYKQNSLKRITVGGQFSSQLQLLRKRIDATSPHYIRCLKPNDKLEPDNFDSAVIAEQLRCAGILEAVRVSRVGYPQRYLHERFVQRYQVLALKELQLRRKDASTNFTSPVGIGFHGGFVPKNQRSMPTRKTANTGHSQKRLNPEQECKILVTSLARQLLLAKQSDNAPAGDENVPPLQNHWVSPGKQKKQNKWPTPGSSRYAPNSSKKQQELDLMEVGMQLGKTKVFLRQHAFEALEVMRGRIKSKAATVLNSVFRMFMKRRRFIVMRNEYRARVAQRSRMIQEGGVVSEKDFLLEAANASFESANSKFDFREMQVSIHREEDFRNPKDFKWVMVDNRWVKNDEDEEEPEAQSPGRS